MKGCEINFTLNSTAIFHLEAKNKKQAKELAEDYLHQEMSRFELLDRLLAAIDYGGLKVTDVNQVEV